MGESVACALRSLCPLIRCWPSSLWGAWLGWRSPIQARRLPTVHRGPVAHAAAPPPVRGPRCRCPLRVVAHSLRGRGRPGRTGFAARCPSRVVAHRGPMRSPGNCYCLTGVVRGWLLFLGRRSHRDVAHSSRGALSTGGRRRQTSIAGRCFQRVTSSRQPVALAHAPVVVRQPRPSGAPVSMSGGSISPLSSSPHSVGRRCRP